MILISKECQNRDNQVTLTRSAKSSWSLGGNKKFKQVTLTRSAKSSWSLGGNKKFKQITLTRLKIMMRCFGSTKNPIGLWKPRCFLLAMMCFFLQEGPEALLDFDMILNKMNESIFIGRPLSPSAW